MNDNLTMVFKIEKEIRETENEFIYSAIYPFCEQVVEHRLSKNELEEILRKGMKYDKMRDRILMALYEVDLNSEIMEDGDIYVKNLDVKRISQKLIAEM